MFEGLYIVEDYYDEYFDVFEYSNNDWVYLRNLRECDLLDFNMVDILREYKTITLLSRKEFEDMGGHW